MEEKLKGYELRLAGGHLLYNLGTPICRLGENETVHRKSVPSSGEERERVLRVMFEFLDLGMLEAS